MGFGFPVSARLYHSLYVYIYTSINEMISANELKR